jgi:hypothetical protein
MAQRGQLYRTLSVAGKTKNLNFGDGANDVYINQLELQIHRQH